MDQLSALPPLQIIPNLTSISGPPLLGLVLNWGLFGVLSTQVYVYYLAFKRDKPYLRAVIYVVYALEVAQTTLLTQTAWFYYASGFGDVRRFDEIGTTWISTIFLGGLVAFLIQLFYAYRLSVISRSNWITGFIILMSVASLAGALGTSIVSAQLRLFSKFQMHKTKSFSMIGLWECAGSACDVGIAISMTYYLKKLSRGGRVMKTQQLVSKIIRLTVETGILTATVSIVSLILCYLYSPQRGYYQVPLGVLAKLYSNSMLVVVNSRVKFHIISEATTWNEVELPEIPLDNRENKLEFHNPPSSITTSQ